MLSAGTARRVAARRPRDHCATSDESEASAARCATSGDVWFVPALLGLGTPVWDFGARGTLVGLTRGSGRPEVVRAVLEGVAHRGADLVEASERDSGHPITALRIDGGMSEQRRVRRGAGRRHRAPGRGLTGRWRQRRSAPASWPGSPSAPTGRPTSWPTPSRPGEPLSLEVTMRVGRRRRQRWLAARAKAEATIPELSGISF